MIANEHTDAEKTLEAFNVVHVMIEKKKTKMFCLERNVFRKKKMVCTVEPFSVVRSSKP